MKYIIRVTLLACVALFANPLVAAPKVSKSNCLKVQGKIDKVNNQLRRGYSVKKGEKLKNRLADYKDFKYQCMKKRFKTG